MLCSLPWWGILIILRVILRGYTEINRQLKRIEDTIKAAIVDRLTAHFKRPVDRALYRNAVLFAPCLELLRRGVLNINDLPVSETE